MFRDILNASRIVPPPPPSYFFTPHFITNAKFPIHIQNFIYPWFGYDDEIRSTPRLSYNIGNEYFLAVGIFEPKKGRRKKKKESPYSQS